MMRKWGYILIICLLAVPTAYGQPVPDDEGKYDTVYVNTLIDRSKQTDAEGALQLLKEAVSVAEYIRFEEGVENAYRDLFKRFREVDDTENELFYRLKRGRYLEKSDRQDMLPWNTFETGRIFFRAGIYEKAYETYRLADSVAVRYAPRDRYKIRKAMALSARLSKKYPEAESLFSELQEEARKKGLHDDYLNLLQQQAIMAHDRRMHSQSFEINRNIYRIADSLGRGEVSRVALNNLGFAAKYAGKSDEAEAFYREALTTNSDAALRARIKQSLAILLQNKKKFEESAGLLTEVATYYERANKQHDLARTYDILATVYYQHHDAFRALSYNDKAIQIGKAAGLNDVLSSSYSTRSLIYESMYEYKPALEAFQEHLKYKEKVQEVERSRQAKVANQLYIFERTQKGLELDFAALELRDLEIAKLTAENARKEELQKAQLDSAEAALKYARLQEREQESALRIQRQQLEMLRQEAQVKQKESELADAEREKAQKEQERQTAELKARNAESEKQALSKEKELSDLQVKAEQQRVRNLFLILGGLGLLILIIIAILLQLRRKNSKIAKQNQVITENQKVIEAERDKADQLLLNILPPAVAAELKEKGSAAPRQYEAVSVIFTDFSGFTRIAEKLTPSELVETLDKIFLEFDLVCERYGLQRIKTIGDAYMAACGLPDPDPDHAEKTVRAALDMRTYVEDFNKKLPKGEPKWGIRIGVNSGPVVAGVVGIRKFAYDIWGDAVNTASRMESSGEVGKVNVSGQTYELVKNKFEFKHRGKISAKNKGEIDMYFVDHL